MNFEKEIAIRNKVFCDADIKALWKFVSSQTKTNRKGTAGIVVVNKDESVWSRNEDIFVSSNYLKRDIRRIELGYHSEDYNSHITISIEHTAGPYFLSDNYVEIRGDSSDWVELCTSKAQKLLTAARATSVLSRIYGHGGQFLSVMLFSMAYWELFSDFIVPTIKAFTPIAALRLVLALVFVAIGAACIWLTARMSSLFPIVSIDVNKTAHNRRTKICGLLKWLFNSILLPLLFGWLFYRLSATKEGNSCVLKNDKTVISAQEMVP